MRWSNPGQRGHLMIRFPSKLPMFLASGRPVVLPDTNVGTELEDGYNCLKLKSGSASEIVEKVEELIAHRVAVALSV